MPKQETPEVFVSYSRHDEALVKPLAAAIGIGRASSVFVDVEQLKAGNLWETKLINAVRGSKVFVLCWCCEAAKSRFIAKEVRTALEDPSRVIVPVLLCKQKLPMKLRYWQWIDLRGKVVHTCDPNPPKPRMPRTKPGLDKSPMLGLGASGNSVIVKVMSKLEPPKDVLSYIVSEDFIRRSPSPRAVELSQRIESYFNSINSGAES